MNKSILFSLLASFSVAAGAATFEGDPWPGGVVPYKLGTANPISAETIKNLNDVIDYYHDNTSIQFVNVTDVSHNYPEVLTVDGISSGNSNATVGYQDKYIYWGNTTLWIFDATMELRENPGKYTVAHELFHVLGFNHEQCSYDRDEYVTIDIASLTASGEYKNKNYGKRDVGDLVGPYDLNSVSHYKNAFIADKYNVDKTLETMEKIDGFNRAFRINLEDSTPDDIYDNPALHIQSLHTNSSQSLGAVDLEMTDVESGWHSALWDFVPTNTPGEYYIKSYWGKYSNAYLINTGIPSLGEKNSINLSDNYTKWRVIKAGDFLRIQSVVDSQYLRGDSGYLALGSNENFIIQAVTSRDPDLLLSSADKVALSWAYGDYFRLQLSDATESLADNRSLRVPHSNPYGDPIFEILPIIDGNNLWHSAMWKLERKGRFFMLKNRWTNEYLNTENPNYYEADQVRLDPQGAENHDGVDISGWHSAHWDMEISGSSFKIKNRWTGRYLSELNGELVLSEANAADAKSWDLQRVDEGIYDWTAP